MYRLSLLLLLVVCFSTVFTLYEDQIGLYDWQVQYVGATRYRVVDSRVIIVTTEKQILATLDIRTGKVLWRHKFNIGDDILLEPVVSGDDVITYHNSGHYRHWDILSGMLTLDTSHHASELLYYTALSYDHVVRVTKSGVFWGKLDNTGEHPLQISDEMTYVGQLLSGQQSEGFVYVAGQHGKIIRYNGKDSSVDVTDIELPWATNDVKFVTSDDSMAALKGDILYYKVLGADTFRNVILSEVGVTWAVTDIKGAGKSVYIVTGNHMSAILLVRDGFMKAIKAINKDVIGQVVSSDNIVLVSRPDNHASLVQLSNGYEHHGYTLPGGEGRGRLLDLATLPTSHPCSLVSTVKVPGLLLTWEDESTSISGPVDKCGWVREESLSSVLTATMVDLPASSVIPSTLLWGGTVTKHNNPIKMWTDRLLMQLSDMQKFFHTHFGSGFSDVSLEMERDAFNLNKLILAVTRVGKIHVLHSSSGRIVWSSYIQNIGPLQNDRYEIHIVRSSSHYPLPPLVAVIAASHDQKNTVLTVINPLDGTRQYSKKYNSKVAQVQLTAAEDNEAAKVLLILTEDNQVHTYPPNTHRLVQHTPLFFALVYPDKMMLKGFRSTGDKVEETWSIPLRGDRILDVTTKATNDEVYSQGRVLGDRSVLHKYINPNIIAVTVETGTAEKGQVDLQLYDMVSGVQIHHVRHKQYSGPMHVLLAENWLVYHFWSTKLRRYELVVAEFYLQHSPNTTEFSSLFPNAAPYAIQQSYITNSPIAAMTVTTTLKSITNRAILFGETSGRIACIPKQLLDPRRPTVPTAADKYEQLIPYTPQLITPPVSYITYNETLQDISGMITSSSGLESTSLLFVYGTDLYFARVTPAKTFDMLNEDFDYYLIGLVLLGLCFGTIATQALADNKALNKKWK